MLDIDFESTHVKKDQWIKKLRKERDPEKLADLIKQRINFHHGNGPYLKTDQGEEPADIIVVYMAKEPENRAKIFPAVGLLLFKILHNQIQGSTDLLLRGVFTIIRNARLAECGLLLSQWLIDNTKLTTTNNKVDRGLYRDALWAYAAVQSKDEEIEKWWFTMWRGSDSYWWCPAFSGLRKQNPDVAARELTLLISRNINETGYLLAGMWGNDKSKSQIEIAIRKGLEENNGWAGKALNLMIEKLNDDQRNELMAGLKRVAA